MELEGERGVWKKCEETWIFSSLSLSPRCFRVLPWPQGRINTRRFLCLQRPSARGILDPTSREPALISPEKKRGKKKITLPPSPSPPEKRKCALVGTGIGGGEGGRCGEGGGRGNLLISYWSFGIQRCVCCSSPLFFPSRKGRGEEMEKEEKVEHVY